MTTISPITIPEGYRSQAEDTDALSDAMMFQLLRYRTKTQRLEMGARMMTEARQFSLSCLKQQFGRLPAEDFARKVASAWLQEDYPPGFTPKGSDMTWIQDSTSIITILHRVLTDLGIPYYITGGMAAIAYGEPRTTRDVDIVIAVSPTEIDPLVQCLEREGFYIPGVDDVRSGRLQTLSITHMESISRADLVLSGNSAFDQAKDDRKRLIELPGIGSVYFASPEDVVLSKLLWRGQSQSEKQWRDVLGILKVQGETLDFDYLSKWAGQLNLSNDLNQATYEAGLNVSNDN